jgi:hypothetical protein
MPMKVYGKGKEIFVAYNATEALKHEFSVFL